MGTRSRLRKKVAPEFTPAPTQNVLQTRPFAPPAKSDIAPTLADVQAQLDHAQCRGHHLANYATSQPQATTPIIQPKLTIGAPGDKYEQEADRVAGQVVQQLHSPQMESSQEQQSVQRESMPEDDELQMKPMLQMKGGGAIAANVELEDTIQQSRGSGQSLADNLRQPMEHAFGNVDFSGVKVHTDAHSDQLNRSIQAKAFTTGQDIFFRQGAYQPESQIGQSLIAHELTHVLQQNNHSAYGVVQRESSGSDGGSTAHQNSLKLEAPGDYKEVSKLVDVGFWKLGNMDEAQPQDAPHFTRHILTVNWTDEKKTGQFNMYPFGPFETQDLMKKYASGGAAYGGMASVGDIPQGVIDERLGQRVQGEYNRYNFTAPVEVQIIYFGRLHASWSSDGRST